MPRGRARHQSVVVDGKLHLVGGDVEAASNETSLETISQFSIDCCDLEKGTWINPPAVPLIDTSSNTKVAAHGGKLILFEGLKEGRRGKLCVHAFDGKDGRWVYSDIAYQEYVSDDIFLNWEQVEISVNDTDGNLYFTDMFSFMDKYMYAYDVKTESLTRVENMAALGGIQVFRTEYRKGSMSFDDVPYDTFDTISIRELYVSSHNYIDASTVSRGHLPFAVFGHSFLGTKKSAVEWYCRDRLAKLRNENDETKRKKKSACGSKRSDEGNRVFKNENHARGLLAELRRQLKTGAYVDIVLEVEGRRFHCHRAVLASTPYFRTMLSSNFKESHSKVVKICGIHHRRFLKILGFLYEGSIRIRKNNVQDILQAAHMLQIDMITGYCEKVIRSNLHPSNCIGVMRLGNLYGLSNLEWAAKYEAMTHFSEVRQNEEFLSLSTGELINLLGSTGSSSLQVQDEDEVVASVIRWLDHDLESRKTAMSSILQEIRLSCVRVSVLRKLESHPAVQQSPKCLAKITAAKEKHLNGISGKLSWRDFVRRLSKCRPRRTMPNGPLKIIAGGWKGPRTHSTQAIPLESIICIDTDNQQCYHITKLPTSVSGYMSVARGKRCLYVTGGRCSPMIGRGPHSPPSRQAFRYDFPTDTWTELPDIPRGRAGHQSVVVDGKLFLIGGDVEATSELCMDCYDLEEEAWIKPPTLPKTNPSSKLILKDTISYKVVLFEIPICVKEYAMEEALRRVLGRKFGAERTKLVIHAFDVTSKQWESSKDILVLHNVDGHDVFVVSVDDKVYFHFVPSGKTDSYRYVHHVKVYDVNEKTITEVKKVPSTDDVNEVSSTANDNDSLSSSDDEDYDHDLDDCDFWITDDDNDEDDDNEDDNTDDNDNKEDDNNEDEDNKDDDNKEDDNKDDGNKDENNEDDDNKDDNNRDDNDKDEDNKDDDNKEDDNKDDGNKDDDNEDDDNKDGDNKDDDNKDDDNDNLEDLDRPSDRHEDGGVFHRFHTNFQIFDWRFEDDIINHKFKDKDSGERERSTSLFGQSVLIITKKLSIGWYCRDLVKLENSDAPN
ncbi:kelch-like protein 5 [Branchiostoma lanceolatum]|uniref:kelch-like protein 5 n=1 Tax=Branchiostoma lanceolatum TaxID=7740 RepID=UPI00345250AB